MWDRGHGEGVGSVRAGIRGKGIFVSNAYLDCKLDVCRRIVARNRDGLNMTVFRVNGGLRKAKKAKAYTDDEHFGAI